MNIFDTEGEFTPRLLQSNTYNTWLYAQYDIFLLLRIIRDAELRKQKIAVSHATNIYICVNVDKRTIGGGYT